ncbi:MAG: response regulator [Planctomycetes bacterium]|nr:response regulator [Planctomycetota bacterium]
MAKILVVDDSAVDRRLAGGLLSKEGTITVQFCENGAEAVSAIEQAPPDLVITDLQMPEMDGLALVEHIKLTRPNLPVILMTSMGSEEIAVSALEAGAASYVPKRKLAEDLMRIVRQVMEAAAQQSSRAQLLLGMTRTEFTFELANDSTLIPPLISHIQDSVTQMGVCDEADRLRLAIALEEALTNALFHGNLELSSELRDNDAERYAAEVARRSTSPPYADRRVFVDSRFTRDQAYFVIRDEGPGFDPSNLPDPLDPECFDKAGGRGILLMRTFMSEVSFNDTGNEVTLIKRRADGGGNGEAL